MFSPEFTGQRAQIIFHDHTPHLEYSDCHYQMFVACVPLSTKHFKCSLSSIPDSFLVQVAVKDMLVLRWTQRGHCGRPKGHPGEVSISLPNTTGKSLQETIPARLIGGRMRSRDIYLQFPDIPRSKSVNTS